MVRFALRIVAGCWALALLCACDGVVSGGDVATPLDGGVVASADGGAMASVDGAARAGVDAGRVTQLDGSVTTSLPPLPPLDNVFATENDDSAEITFDPIDGAVDYRVYPLPDDSDVQASADGHVVVHNAIYRCAGKRAAMAPSVDTDFLPGDSMSTLVDNQQVGGVLRTLADATLGYVYTHAGPGLVPVYALGEANPRADNVDCGGARWAASRSKKYTTSTAERVQLLTDFARDDGIAFYVPAAADSTTRPIYLAEDQPGASDQRRYYFTDGLEARSRKNATTAFLALAQAAPGAVPLMRVFYHNQCGWSHDELVAGTEQFKRIYKQGDQQPWWTLLWTGISKPTTLVVEALESGCPFQGHLSPESMPSVTANYGTFQIVHQPYFTIADVRASSPTTEVFINGQHDVTTMPKAIARSFIKVAPRPHPKMDFFADFSPSAPVTFGAPVAASVFAPSVACAPAWTQDSADFKVSAICVEQGPTAAHPLSSLGAQLGELWVTYADQGSDTNGKVRLTAKEKARVDASTFLHVTMEVDAVSSGRRYPQIIISDQEAPIQYTLQNGHTLVFQTRCLDDCDWPVAYQLQVCSMRTWDVNNQCPAYDFSRVNDSNGKLLRLAAHDEIGERASVDHRVLFDVYASTRRAYMFIEGKPYGCADLPATGAPPAGPVTVTWGDVLYHSGVDYTFAFHKAHMQNEMRRHFDNLGFSTGVPAPEWDEARFPCVAPITP